MGKKLKTAQGKVEADKEYSLEDAIACAKEASYAKFDETGARQNRFADDRKRGYEGLEIHRELGSGSGGKIAAVSSKSAQVK